MLENCLEFLSIFAASCTIFLLDHLNSENIYSFTAADCFFFGAHISFEATKVSSPVSSSYSFMRSLDTRMYKSTWMIRMAWKRTRKICKKCLTSLFLFRFRCLKKKNQLGSKAQFEFGSSNFDSYYFFLPFVFSMSLRQPRAFSSFENVNLQKDRIFEKLISFFFNSMWSVFCQHVGAFVSYLEIKDLSRSFNEIKQLSNWME